MAKKKRTLFNALMVFLIVVAGAGALIMVGSIKGWFDKTASVDSAVISDETGVVGIERSGIAYYITDKLALRDGDIILTQDGSSALITFGKNTLKLGAETQIKIVSATKGEFGFEINTGEGALELNKPDQLKDAIILGKSLSAKEGVYGLNAQSGSSTIYVLSGSAEIGGKSAEKGGLIAFAGDDADIGTTSASSLSEFMINTLKPISESAALCFTKEELEKVLTDRAAEIQRAAEDQAAREAEILARGGTVPVISSTSGSKGSNGSSGSIAVGGEGSAVKVGSCTITIRCDTILDNMSSLTKGKGKYVPSNGVILATSKVEFTEGETVYEVLKRACTYAGIQLEYSWTPMYNSYYIEGINHLYEFDCGNESGWMYKVNGWFPNYGCSSYELDDGDTIVWCYTCNGLGADVGGSVY